MAPQNQVYEYILFRGSDIKDIRVVNNVSSIPNDPAIVQVIIFYTTFMFDYIAMCNFDIRLIDQINCYIFMNLSILT